MRVRLPRLPFDTLVVKRKSWLSAKEQVQVRLLAGVLASMVKRTSSQASNLGFRVRILVEALCPWCSRLAHDAVNVEVVGSSPPGHLEAGVRDQESGVRDQESAASRLCLLTPDP